jgi:hypothetical protein
MNIATDIADAIKLMKNVITDETFIKYDKQTKINLKIIWDYLISQSKYVDLMSILASMDPKIEFAKQCESSLFKNIIDKKWKPTQKEISQIEKIIDRFNHNKDFMNSLLIIATQLGSLYIVQKLLEADTDPNTGITHGAATPLILATQNGYSFIVEALLRVRTNEGVIADTDTQDEFGRTALHYAANISNAAPSEIAAKTAITKLLLKRGADTRLRDNNGYTAMHYAVQTRNLEFQNLMFENAAKNHPTD